jgi:hypothetical protein
MKEVLPEIEKLNGYPDGFNRYIETHVVYDPQPQTMKRIESQA